MPDISLGTGLCPHSVPKRISTLQINVEFTNMGSIHVVEEGKAFAWRWVTVDDRGLQLGCVIWFPWRRGFDKRVITES